MNKTLKIGVVIDNDLISNYLADLITWSKNTEDIDISSYLYLHNYEEKQIIKKSKLQKIVSLSFWKGYPNKKFKNFIVSFEKNRNLKNNKIHKNSVDKHNINDFGLKKIDVYQKSTKSKLSFSATENSIDTIKEEQFDLLLRFNKKIIRGDLLTITNFGILSMHHGSDLNYRGGPSGFWEVYNSDNMSGYIIQQLTEELDNGNILFRGFISTQKSWLLNKSELNLRSFFYLKKIILEISKTHKLPNFLVNIPYSKSLNTDPTILEMIKYLFKKFKNKQESKKYKNANNRYLVGYQEGEWGKLNYRNANFIKNPENTFLADPFIISKNFKNYCFLESYDYILNKGTIDVYELTPSTSKLLGTAIEEDFHLSFPYLIETEDEIYMIPESSKNRDIRIYKSTEFPLKWKLEKVLIDDIDASDSIIFHHNNLWWLLTNVDDLGLGDHNYQLNIYYSENLLSNDWKPHKLNPVIMNPSHGRNGGFLKQDKNLYRVAQKYGFNQKYGEGITIRKIEEITKETYREIEIASYDEFYNNNILGSHHLSSNNIFTVFDIWKSQ